jgi:mannose/cellobiose epimerase-like protein (N-acyl-D-glucosamine 2-epimerase family)
MNTLQNLHAELIEWLVRAAYPLWSTRGIDPRDGGFIEALDRNAVPLNNPRRARVHPRQVYAFARGPSFGWQGDVAGIVARGTEYFTTHYQRRDGLFRTLVGADGAVLDERALLYDQAFALLGYAAVASATNARNVFEPRALELRHAIEGSFAAGDGSFFSDEEFRSQRESNPHMHLLEACLAWAEIGDDPGWTQWVGSLVELALLRFIHRETGAVEESYEDAWKPASGIAGRVIEPGHQFEWAWLLLRSEHYHTLPSRQAALRLISIGETFGIHNGVAINSLLGNFTAKNVAARLWPQTERLKAALRAASVTGDANYRSIAQTTATSLLRYLNTPTQGLWFDEQMQNGDFVDSSAPASTFYHLVGAIAELHLVLRNDAKDPASTQVLVPNPAAQCTRSSPP